MATVSYSAVNTGNVQNVSWSGLTTNDYGQAWFRSDFQDKTFQIKGDFGSGATCAIYGSNEITPVLTDDSDWEIVTDTTETAVSTTSKIGGSILQNYRWIRPKVTGGTSPSIKVIIEAVKGV
jgi:hypothetical protein